MSSLTEEESEPLEDHLMFCQSCQDRLESVEAYLLVARQASRQVRQEAPNSQARASVWSRFTRFFLSSLSARNRPGNWFALTATAGALACVALFLMLPHSQQSGYQQIRLEAVRGAEASTSDSRRPLEIVLDVAGLPAFPTYRVEVVSASGTVSAALNAQQQGNAITARTKANLPPGEYWVRIYGGASNEPLREFALRSN